jgi:hypothetical protein
MTNTETSGNYDTDFLLAQVRELGEEHGKASGSWVEIDDEVSAQRCIQLDDEGDPEWHDIWGARAPLSGEMADDFTPALLARALDVEIERLDDAVWGEVMEAYEQAYYDAHRDEVLRIAKVHA